MTLTSPKKPSLFLGLSPLDGENLLRTQHPEAWIVGIDEAGRGPLAGPVVAAAVVLPSADGISGLNDSKKLSEKRREELFPQIQKNALAWAIAEASPAEIDQFNILQADFLAMRRALKALGITVSNVPESGVPQTWSGIRAEIPNTGVYVAVDGNLWIAGFEATQQEPVVKGDAHVASIAAASILAKVHRDHQMVALDRLYPQYGFAQHKGYPSPAHLDAIRQHGLCPEHRRSFRPKALEQLDLLLN
ncbi:MAG TPA: ribonuclease HII [Fibrobacteraceae bacterium]|nr:ribonuclease HII [Fibrobacteraceae bacterium]